MFLLKEFPCQELCLLACSAFVFQLVYTVEFPIPFLVLDFTFAFHDKPRAFISNNWTDKLIPTLVLQTITVTHFDSFLGTLWKDIEAIRAQFSHQRKSCRWHSRYQDVVLPSVAWNTFHPTNRHELHLSVDARNQLQVSVCVMAVQGINLKLVSTK